MSWREDLRKECEQLRKANSELDRQAGSAAEEIRRLGQIIASLRYKLFGNRKGEMVDTAQLELQHSNIKLLYERA